MKLYREVKASERLPGNTVPGNTSELFNVIDEDGMQRGDYYDYLENKWGNEWCGYKVEYWLEEIPEHKGAEDFLKDFKIYGHLISSFLLPDQIKFIEKAMEQYAASTIPTEGEIESLEKEIKTLEMMILFHQY